MFSNNLVNNFHFITNNFKVYLVPHQLIVLIVALSSSRVFAPT